MRKQMKKHETIIKSKRSKKSKKISDKPAQGPGASWRKNTKPLQNPKNQRNFKQTCPVPTSLGISYARLDFLDFLDFIRVLCCWLTFLTVFHSQARKLLQNPTNPENPSARERCPRPSAPARVQIL